ncbi:hypothetical protein NUU61_006933 [Penicillium alfredii]|uniref:Integral membrane protein n=1 Tax=Penicillium alfredii TaxID=1506179 RepID=A0A9W9F1Q8_9EURO|nr:uncharacterized protein NUU61_006933 [Penicillium alfredii]KAJ5092063.1 hypothetical protein NUU61_006933 [Penicillium alfredii]
MILLGKRPPILGASNTGAGAQTLRVFLSFLLFYALLVLYTRTQSSRDPGSAFFRPWTAYDASYSAVRLDEADRYIDSVNNNNGTAPKPAKASPQPGLCVGIASIARNGIRYFRSTVGTVLEGLSEAERADIHLVLFIAHTDPAQHPAYNETWLHEVADRVLLYEPDKVNVDYIRSLETDAARVSGREKALFDYTYLLQACEATNAPYVVMLEDDVVAQDGWYHRTRQALASAEEQTKKIGASKWLYLRLFYTEEFLGWNAQDWPIYLAYSILAAAFVACVGLGLRQHRPQLHAHLPNETILLLTGVCTPLMIGLFFAAGRVTMLPIPTGVHQMPRFGCCSQAFVFPRARVPDLVELYRARHLGYVDVITEEYANANNEIRWAVTPSIMQHAGRRSSKAMNDDPAGGLRHKSKSEISEVGKLWNFGFELNDAAALRAEHSVVLGQGG